MHTSPRSCQRSRQAENTGELSWAVDQVADAKLDRLVSDPCPLQGQRIGRPTRRDISDAVEKGRAIVLTSEARKLDGERESGRSRQPGLLW